VGKPILARALGNDALSVDAQDGRARLDVRETGTVAAPAVERGVDLGLGSAL
jgi:hypothetical protein